ncbi:Regulatory protein RecX [Micrococcus luteus]|uniref:regulatory protein RecX n=1 Tax=Micrococcus luteus TaxID=1270 RepID=UPI0007638053|nr:regulatory protein RecX [Micrococcus luteus]KWW40528.1 Regulatory protein RecX [Micrococcus luteus]PAL18821.1 RecX family transcriptional regulator [Micrococcus luteus]
MTRSRRNVGGGAAHRSETTGRSGSASGASAFDDARDTDAARMWLELAGVPEADGPVEERNAGTASPAVPPDNPVDRSLAAAGNAPASAPSGPVPARAEAEAPDLGSLLGRASDLPSPSPGAAARVLPWSTDARPARDGGGAPSGPRRVRRRNARPSAADAASTPEEARPRRRPGPAPLPADPQEREEAAREVVLRQLALGPRSRGQLEAKLTEREAEPALIARVLDRFEEVRLVDDVAFAEVWVRSRHRSKGLARRAIGHELRQKGVDRDVAAEALEAIDGEDERAAALELVRRRLRGRRVPAGNGPDARAERDKVTRRLVGMLGRKGYGGGLAFAVVREALQEQG